MLLIPSSSRIQHQRSLSAIRDLGLSTTMSEDSTNNPSYTDDQLHHWKRLLTTNPYSALTTKFDKKYYQVRQANLQHKKRKKARRSYKPAADESKQDDDNDEKDAAQEKLRNWVQSIQKEVPWCFFYRRCQVTSCKCFYTMNVDDAVEILWFMAKQEKGIRQTFYKQFMSSSLKKREIVIDLPCIRNPIKLCMHSFRNLFSVRCVQFARLRKELKGGNTGPNEVRHKNNDNRSRSSMLAQCKSDVVEWLQKFAEEHGEMRATRLHRESNNLGARNVEVNLLYIPSNFTKRRIYCGYVHHNGYQMLTADRKGSYGSTSNYKPRRDDATDTEWPEGMDPNPVCAFSVFCRIWRLHCPLIVSDRSMFDPQRGRSTNDDNDEPMSDEDDGLDCLAPIGVVEDDERFVTISNLYKAGLSAKDEPQLFYQRTAFRELSDFIDKIVEGCHIGLIDGLPGTGKSSTLWWGLRKLTKRRLLWINLDRQGNVNTLIEVKDASIQTLAVPMNGWRGLLDKLKKLSAQSTILVFDGVNHSIYNDAFVALRDFVMKDLNGRCGFITMSGKITREHKHNLEIYVKKQRDGVFVAQFYHTHHSWTLDDYVGAYVNPDQSATPLFFEVLPVFAEEWNIDMYAQFMNTSDEGSKKFVLVEEAVTQKFAFAGGSARWMASETTHSISAIISSYLQECVQLDSLMNFKLGEQSPPAQTHLYFASQDDAGLTVYSLISQHATLLAVENLSGTGAKSLYRHATRLNDPAFLGWVIEACIVQRCLNGALVFEDTDGSAVQFTQQANDPIEFDHDSLVNGASARSLIPSPGKTNVCRPKKWNRGGYDFIFLSTGWRKNLALRFCQVSKSSLDSLKLEYFAEVVNFLSRAGYDIESVEIAFLVATRKISDYCISPNKVFGRGRLSHVDLPRSLGRSKWVEGREEELISVYAVDLINP